VNKIEIPSTTGFTACHEQFPSPRVAMDVARFSLGVRHLGSTLQTIGEREGISYRMLSNHTLIYIVSAVWRPCSVKAAIGHPLWGCLMTWLIPSCFMISL
jgi:hypothetical protein